MIKEDVLSMQVKVEQITTWGDVYREALATEGKNSGGVLPNDKWRKKILLAEHSPIRVLEYRFEFSGLPYWSHVHLVRHKFGVEHFVATQRDDRTADTIPRGNKPQSTEVQMVMRLNAQAIINISRRRLCSKASTETRKAWELAIKKLEVVDPVLAVCCVPECLYRGFCPERKSCGRTENKLFQLEKLTYREGVNYGWKKNEITNK